MLDILVIYLAIWLTLGILAGVFKNVDSTKLKGEDLAMSAFLLFLLPAVIAVCAAFIIWA